MAQCQTWLTDERSQMACRPPLLDFTQSPANARSSRSARQHVRQRSIVTAKKLRSIKSRLHLYLCSLTLLSLLITATTALTLQPQEIGDQVQQQLQSGPIEAQRAVPDVAASTIILQQRQIDFRSATNDKPRASKTSAFPKPSAQQVSPSSSETQTPSDTALPADDGVSISTAAPSVLASSQLPKAFDGGLGTNFTQPSCPRFLKQMANNESFMSCVPFSVLLQNSNSFFQASRSASSLDAILTAACTTASFETCSTLMSRYANELRDTDNCKDDYSRQNPTVRQAYTGLTTYDVLYRASCLRVGSTAGISSSSTSPSRKTDTTTDSNANTGTGAASYCFTRSRTNTSAPTDSYIYFLPLGLDLPSGALPSCTTCLQNTMGIFAAAGANKSQEISSTYSSAARAVNLNCGPVFVNLTVATSRAGSGTGNSAAKCTGRPPDTIRLVACCITVVNLLGLFASVLHL